MSNSAWLALLKSHRSIAVIRAPQLELGVQMATAVAAGGLRLIEITWNSDQPAKLIEQLRSTLPDCVIGAGTLLTVREMQEAIAAGAQYLFSPHTNPTLIQTALHYEIPVIPGALSPTEIVTAWQAGASSVKVFPVQSVGGVNYIQNLQAPLGCIPLIPSGGITLDNAKDYINVGAIAVGLSSELFLKDAIAQQDWSRITRCAEQLMENLEDGLDHSWRLLQTSHLPCSKPI